MKMPAACFLAGLMATMLFAELLCGQETARLSGFVWDSSASRVPGATITAVNEETGFRRITHSAADGAYQIAYLNPGQYKVTIRRGGFRIRRR